MTHVFYFRPYTRTRDPTCVMLSLSSFFFPSVDPRISKCWRGLVLSYIKKSQALNENL